MTSESKTANEIRRVGIAAVLDTLGPVQTIRFLMQFDPGGGDYTAERDRLLGEPTVEDLLRELKAKKSRPKSSGKG
jgi:hypothetical protein